MNSRLIRPINITDVGSPAYTASADLVDGVHPSVAGCGKIGNAIASVILYRLWAALMFPADDDTPAKEATCWGGEADQDNGCWINSLGHHLDTNPNTSAAPNPLVTQKESDFEYTISNGRRSCRE
ncbi:MAG: hypothetical protein GWQ05_05835 [Verrucomicrobiaceae bacterium]|nr:hypothetical protein [Verrucomicrobiaceae bacterium]NCF90466.1 hypothetical protein [Verrucomicrobiaceae bacterium]